MPQTEKTTAERVEQQVIAGRSFNKSMNFVQSISKEDEQFERENKDFVHLPPIHNNTFVTVTDARGNKKTGASAGCLKEIKGGSRLSRYAARATCRTCRAIRQKSGDEVGCNESERIYLFQEKESSDLQLERRLYLC